MVVVVMVVVESGEAKKSDYRKFRIRSVAGANDPAALKEVLRRRLKHLEWPLPKVILMDGNVIQRNAAKEVLIEHDLDDVISILSVVKDEHHKARAIEGDSVIIEKYRNDLLLANGEAHRFAIAFHKKLRAKSFLQ